MKKHKRKKNDSLLWGGIMLLLLFGGLFKNNIMAVAVLVVGIPIGMIVFSCWKKEKQKQKYLTSGMQDVDRLSGEEFEYFLCTYFKALGYSAKVTPATNDYGADVIALKDGEKIVIQAKRYKDNVGVRAVQEVIGAKGYYSADRAMVVTCAYFTPNAKNLARENSVELWDREKLKTVMENIQGKTLLDGIKREEEYQLLDRRCPNCGAHMVLRYGKKGDFLGCENFPDCKYTKGLY